MILKSLTGLCLLLLVCGGWQCNTALVEELVPTAEEAPPFDLRELIRAEDGVVHSPIPDDAYSLLWGNEWEREWAIGKKRDPERDPEMKSLYSIYTTLPDPGAPRRYFTKYIDADGIAIVGGSHIDDELFHAARGVVRAMMWKIPEVREELSLTPGRRLIYPNFVGERIYFGPNGFDGYMWILEDIKINPSQFRVVLLGPGEHKHLDDVPGVDPCSREDAHGCATGHSIVWSVAWSVAWSDDLSNYVFLSTLVHEMAHAIHSVFIHHPELFPDFQERLEAAYEKEMARVAAGERPLCFHEPDAYAYTKVSEFWAVAVTIYWFRKWHWATSDPPEPAPYYVDPDVDYADYDDLADIDENLLYPFYPDEERHREICGDLVDLISEVFHMPSMPAN